MKTGKLAENVLKRSVLKKIGKGAGVGADCAFFSIMEGRELACSMQEAALDARLDAECAEMLVQKAVNNLATAGAKPSFAMTALMLPTACEEADVGQIMAEIANKCREYDLEVLGGDTNVTSCVISPILTINVFGVTEKQCRHDLSMARAGQDIVVSKWIGLEGTAILAKYQEDKLLQRYPAYLVEEAKGFRKYLSILPEAFLAAKNDVMAMHDVSQGGIFGALWELAEGAGVGLQVDLKKIPIRQETVEVCEVCGVNPYEMRSMGSLIMTTADGEKLVRELEMAGISASIIGRLTDSQERVVINGEEKRYLDRPRGGDAIAELLENGQV